jgi:AraC-like DNA-binding protein
METLDDDSTQAALREHGLDRPEGVGFSFCDPSRNRFYDWHDHPYHQLIYASAGATQIEAGRARFLLPCGRSAWIPAGVRHRTMIADWECVSLYFDPVAVPDREARVRILVTGPMMHEMVMHARRWPLGIGEQDLLASSFFRTLGLLCGEWLQAELPLRLPGATSPALTRAMDETLRDLGHVSQSDAVRAAGMSERSFRRAFFRETGLRWQAWVTQARMLEAMGRLAGGGRVTDVAADAGYASLSAFAKAFVQLTGETPTAYRSRVRKPVRL